MTCSKCGAEIKSKLFGWAICRRCYNDYHGKYQTTHKDKEGHRLYMRVWRLSQQHENGCKLHNDCFTCPFEDCIA